MPIEDKSVTFTDGTEYTTNGETITIHNESLTVPEGEIWYIDSMIGIAELKVSASDFNRATIEANVNIEGDYGPPRAVYTGDGYVEDQTSYVVASTDREINQYTYGGDTIEFQVILTSDSGHTSYYRNIDISVSIRRVL